MPAPIKKVSPVIRDATSQFERETAKLARDTNTSPMVSGVLLTGVALTTGTTRVVHKLGRPYKGWMVVDTTTSGTVWRDASDNTRVQDAIPLIASTAMTVSLWVF